MRALRWHRTCISKVPAMEKVFFETALGERDGSPAAGKVQREKCVKAGKGAGAGGARARKSVVIVNRAGLHLRTVAEFARVACGFPCSVCVRENGQEADGKSVLSLLCLGAYCGVTISIEAAGERCEEAVEKLSALVSDGFGGMA